MKVTRNVIVDLLPLYVAGEASPDTRALVDDYLKGDPELAISARANNLESLTGTALPVAGPHQDAEISALRRTRSLLRWQRRLYAWALALSILPFSSVFYTAQGHFKFQLLLRDYPSLWGGCLSLAITCWINYLVIRRKLRISL